MKIYIAACDPRKAYREKYIREIALLAQNQTHVLVENPENADIILVTEPIFTFQHEWELLNKHLDKCYGLGTNLTNHLMLPGLYNNAPCSPLQKYRYRGCSYIFCRDKHRNSFLDFHSSKEKKHYLFSFVGGSTSWVRKHLLKIKFSRNDVLIRSTNEYNHWIAHQPNRESMQKSFIDTIQSSMFALCPRGSGCGIIRVFEAMELGVSPVIISDKWLAPIGPDWENFAIFVKQSDLNNLVEIVEGHASEYEERGRLARKAWEEHFSDLVVFNRCIEAIEDLKGNRIAVLDRLIFYAYPITSTIIKLKKTFKERVKWIILKFFSLFKLKFPYELVNK